MTAQVKAFAIGRHAANSIQHTLRCKKSTYFLQKAVASILPGTLAWYATWMCGSSLKSCCWICGVMDSVTCKGEVCAKQLRWGWSRWVADAQHCNMINAGDIVQTQNTSEQTHESVGNLHVALPAATCHQRWVGCCAPDWR